MTDKTHARLCVLLLRHLAPAELRTARERPWASITFSGARHWLAILVRDADAEHLATSLAEAEFDLPGAFVADIAVTARLPDPGGCVLMIEALTVID